MSEAAASNEFSTQARPHVSETRRIVQLFFKRKIAVFGLLIIVALFVVGILAPVISPHDPYEVDPANALADPSSEYLNKSL